MINTRILGIVFMGTGFLWAGSAANYLENMDPETRTNAMIDLESAGEAADKLHEAEFLWNTGKYSEAIALVDAIESESGDISIGISWREPITTASPKWSTDVQVSPLTVDITSNPELILAHSGNLFAVAKGDTTGSSSEYWFLYMSTDGGESWAETYSWRTSNSIIDVNAAEYASYVYVAYASTGSAPTSARVRRFDDATGSSDVGFGYVNAISASATIKEVNIEPNRYTSSQIYYSALDTAGNLYLAYSGDSGQTWSDFSMGITNADRGLDMDYGYMNSSGHIMWLSYISTGDSLCVRGLAGYQRDNLAAAHFLSYMGTSIAQHGDTVIVFYERSDYTLRYFITYDDGSNWATGGGSIYSDSAAMMDITGRGDQGWHLSFASYTASGPEVVRYTHRGYPSGSWDANVSLGDHDAFIQYKTSIDYLGSPGAYGVLYVDDNQVMWFDRMDWTDVAEGARPLPMEFKALSGPSSTSLSFVLPEKGFVSLKVYDARGALVKDLSGTYGKGLNKTVFTSQGAGTFFAILQAGDQVARTKFISTR